MFPNQIQFDKDVEFIVVIVELVYLRIIHLICPFMDPYTRERCVSLPLLRVAKVFLN